MSLRGSQCEKEVRGVVRVWIPCETNGTGSLIHDAR